MNRSLSGSRAGAQPSIAAPVAEWGSVVLAVALESQRIQMEWLSKWQRSLLGMHGEIWDWWISRFAGGVPLDA